MNSCHKIFTCMGSPLTYQYHFMLLFPLESLWPYVYNDGSNFVHSLLKITHFKCTAERRWSEHRLSESFSISNFFVLPVFYPSYFNLEISRWTELKHPNFSVFRIENLGLKFMFSTHEVIFESKCNLTPSWLAQTTLLHLKIVFAHLQWHPINKLG